MFNAVVANKTGIVRATSLCVDHIARARIAVCGSIESRGLARSTAHRAVVEGRFDIELCGIAYHVVQPCITVVRSHGVLGRRVLRCLARE